MPTVHSPIQLRRANGKYCQDAEGLVERSQSHLLRRDLTGMFKKLQGYSEGSTASREALPMVCPLLLPLRIKYQQE